MQINIELNGKCCWASRLGDLLLSKFGFGFVWLQKSVGNERAFWAILKERLGDDFNQEWTTAINSSERFCLYASFKSNLLTENYLDFLRIKCFRDVLIKLRMGVLPLNANRFRYAHENASKILCSFCETEIEDEAHFICFCPLYKELRQKYIHRYLIIIIIMHIYHALINALSAHMIHIKLNMIFYTHVEHSPTKTIYIKYYKAHHTHTHTHTVAETGILVRMEIAN